MQKAEQNLSLNLSFFGLIYSLQADPQCTNGISPVEMMHEHCACSGVGLWKQHDQSSQFLQDFRIFPFFGFFGKFDEVRVQSERQQRLRQLLNRSKFVLVIYFLKNSSNFLRHLLYAPDPPLFTLMTDRLLDNV